MQILLNLLIYSVAVYVTSSILPGVRLDGFATAVVVAVLLGAVNTFIKPMFAILTLPVTILTLGLFAFLINAFMILLVDMLVPGFEVSGFLWAILFSLVLSLTSSVLNSLTSK